MNYFVEGLQGSGKSTLVKRLSEKHPNYTAIHEGDYSPVELAWCAYVDRETYKQILEKYKDIRDEIEKKSFAEDDHVIICYTKILTDIPGFHKELEKYEIYNGNLDSEIFRDIVLRRFKNWQGDNNIFECSIFQNIIEDMILFQKCSDEEIVDFYKQIKEVLADKPYEIVYLQADDIKSNIDIIRKERSDDQGNEMWFPLMLGYFDNSPYALEKGVKGTEALLEHFKHRQELELRICEELFPERNIVLRSKNYKI
ncbi:P-loop NTPase family protein [Pseudobutyrivibrio xylanivorans]|uniref:AAA domain-containing protein n=1 Tax=Pseudobutyrivibrio xylanivorans DSM 14809 TaxID=1123012 RepID=A0A1M6E2P9_PSEXY|nr:deoxynucleoside kinase [Pseudobutyrivibrio xylanivorans]SHI79814.1 AAA domain-containing protein [Pseudobutyrivibrio xylanivorans DSM 14809]